MNPITEISAPSRWGLWREARLVREAPRLAIGWHGLLREPKGQGRPVMTLPGYGTDQRVLFKLERYLRRQGYRVRDWGLGRNGGNVEKLLPPVTEQVERRVDEEGRPISLVGWSLGGFLAREVARDRPELVDRLVTLGTPIVGGPKYTVVASAYRRRGFDLDSIEDQVAERDEVLIQAPLTAVFSRSDGVVAWEACIDQVHPHVEHREVHSSHFGLLFDPDAYRHTARGLAEAER